jgi:hypothetical protein
MLLNDRNLRESMGQRGRALTINHFTWDQLARQFSWEMSRTIGVAVAADRELVPLSQPS